MSSSIYELIVSACIGGLITGVIAPTFGEWLKGFFNGFHAAQRKKKHKEKIIDLLRYNKPEVTSISTSINGIKKLFKKENNDYIYELLMELYREGRVEKLIITENMKTEEYWKYKHIDNIREVYM